MFTRVWMEGDKITYDEDRVDNPCGGLNTRTDAGLHTSTRVHSRSHTETYTCTDTRASAESARMGVRGDSGTCETALWVLDDNEQQLSRELPKADVFDRITESGTKTVKSPCTQGCQVLLGDIAFSSGRHDF